MPLSTHDPHTGRLLEWVVEHADDGYVILDSGGRVLSANATARAVLDGADRPTGDPFWRAVAATHTVVGEPAAGGTTSGPVYLIRPETASEPGTWHRADRLPAPDAFGGQVAVRLRDVTDERRMRQALWAFRATQKYGMKLKVPKGGATAQVAEAGRGVRTDEWLRVLQTWVSLAAPTGSQVLVAGPLPARGLVCPMEGFALLAAEMLQFVRHPVRGEEEARAAMLVASATADAVTLTARCPVRQPSAEALRQRWTPHYRGQVGGPPAGEPESFPDSFTGEAASLVWHVGGRVDTRADVPAGWVEVALTIPLQSADVNVFEAADADHSLMGA